MGLNGILILKLDLLIFVYFGRNSTSKLTLLCVCLCVLGSLGFPGQKGEKGHAGAAGPKGLRVSFQHIIEQKDLKKSIFTLIFTYVYILNKFSFFY